MTEFEKEYDYEKLIKQFADVESVTTDLQNATDSIDYKLWLTLDDYYQAKKRYEDTDRKEKKMVNTLFDKIVTLDNINENYNLTQEKLKNLQVPGGNIEIRKVNKSKEFFEKAEELHEKIKTLPSEFDNDNVNKHIETNVKDIQFVKQKIVSNKTELENLRRFQENTDFQLINIKRVINNIQNTMLGTYVDIARNETYLSESKQDIAFLWNKIQDITVKSSI